MKLLPLLCLWTACALSACQGWPSVPYNYHPNVPPATRTPLVETATPFVLSPTVSAGTGTAMAAVTPASETPTLTATSTAESPSVTPVAEAGTLKLVILGCDTSVDVLHGMGEVTNAYVTISNASESDAANVCATLNALDEGRAHPDKTKCLPSIPRGDQVTLKLTVDTTYKADTPIQVDLTSDDTLLLRSGEPACKAIGLLLPKVSELGVLVPIP